jgi:hypothetical protein
MRVPPDDALDRLGLSALRVRLNCSLAVAQPTRSFFSSLVLPVSASVRRQRTPHG